MKSGYGKMVIGALIGYLLIFRFCSVFVERQDVVLPAQGDVIPEPVAFELNQDRDAGENRIMIVPSGAEKEAPEAGIKYLRFLLDGVPVRDVQVLRGSERTALVKSDNIIGVSDEQGMVDCSLWNGGSVVAFAEGVMPVAVDLVQWVGTRDVAMKEAQKFVVSCVDDSFRAVSRCLVAIRSNHVAKEYYSLEMMDSISNPAHRDYSCWQQTGDSGAAEFWVDKDVPLYVYVLHPHMFPVTGSILDGEPVDPRAGFMQVSMVPAWGLLARAPEGVEMQQWRAIAKTDAVDRRLFTRSMRMKFALQDVFRGDGVYVAATLGGSGVKVTMQALDQNGVLWEAESDLCRISDGMQPIYVQPCNRPAGWIRVDIRACDQPVDNIPIRMIGSDGHEWAVASGRPVQVPHGVYSLSPGVLVPGVDEALAAKDFHVDANQGGGVQVLELKIPLVVGIVDLDVRLGNDGRRVPISLMTRLENGDSFVSTAIVKERLVLPMGLHRIALSAPGYVPFEADLKVESGKALHMPVTLMPIR